jgi:hypothetical protein
MSFPNNGLAHCVDSLNVVPNSFLSTAKEFLGTTCREVIIAVSWIFYPYHYVIDGPNTNAEFSLRTASFEHYCNAKLLRMIFRVLDFQLLASIHSVNYSPDTPGNFGV